MLLSCVSFAAPAPVAVENAGEIIESTPIAEEAVELASEVPTPSFLGNSTLDTSSYGELAYYDDFESYEVGTVLPEGTVLKYFNSTLFKGFKPTIHDAYQNASTAMVFTVVADGYEEDGVTPKNKMLKISMPAETTAANAYIQSGVYLKDEKGTISDDAVITSVFDAKIPTDSLVKSAQHWLCGTAMDNNAYKYTTPNTTLSEDAWTTSIATTSISEEKPLMIVRLLNFHNWNSYTNNGRDSAYTSAELAMYVDNLSMFAKLPENVATTTPPSDPELGEAIFFETFEDYELGAVAVDTVFNQKSAVKNSNPEYKVFFSTYANSHNFEVVANPNGEGKVLKVTRKTDSEDGSKTYATAGTEYNQSQVMFVEQKAAGAYTSVADMYVPEGTAAVQVKAPIWYGNTQLKAIEYASTPGAWQSIRGTYVKKDETSNGPTNILYQASFSREANTTFTAAQTTYYMDNIGLYRADPPTVTFDSTDASEVPAAVKGYSIDLAQYAATPASSEVVFMGWSKTAGGAIVSGTLEITEDIVLYPVFGTELRDTTNLGDLFGTLIISEDFQGRADGFTIVNSNTNVKYINKEAQGPLVPNAETDNWTPQMRWARSDSKLVLKSEAGNNFMRVQWNEDHTFSGDNTTMYTIFEISKSSYTKPGVYTSVIDYRTASSTSMLKEGMKTSFATSIYKTGTDSHYRGDAAVSPTWQRAVSSLVVDGETVKGANGIINFASFKNIPDLTNEDVVYDYDNFAFYYRPFYSLTFDANGKADATLPEAATIKTTSIKLSDYTASCSDSTVSFLGWATTPDGEVVTGDLALTGDTTLYAKWGVQKIHPGISLEFDTVTEYTNAFGALNAVPGYTITHNVDADGTKYIRFKAADENNKVNDPQRTFTFGAPVLFENIKGVELRVRTNDKYPSGTGYDTKFYHIGSDYSIGESHTFSTFIEHTYDWHTLYIDLSAKRDKYKDMTKFRWDMTPNTVVDGFQFDVDYIRFILDDDVTLNYKDAVSGATVTAGENKDKDISDYRSGIYNVTYTGDVASEADFKEAFLGGNASELFALESLTFDGVDTYTFSAKANLADKTWKVTGATTETSKNINYVKGYQYKFEPVEFDDGENLVPNGDFSNPYYNVWTGTTQSREIVNNSLKVTLSTSRNAWQGTTFKGLRYKPNTKYFYSASLVTKNELDIPVPVSGVSLYLPFQEGLFDGSERDMYSTYNGDLVIGNMDGETDVSGKVYTQSGDITIYDEALYSTIAKKNSATSYSDGTYTAESLEALGALTGVTYQDRYFYQRAQSWLSDYNRLFKTGGDVVFLTSCGNICETNVKPEYAGFAYYITDVTVKEMFPVTVLSDGVATEQKIWLAKDEAVKLPATTLVKEGYVFEGYQIGDVLYVPGAYYTAQAFNEDLTINAVWAANNPETVQTAEIRTDAPVGMRFQAIVTYDQAERADEYGFIIARETKLQDAGLTNDQFTHDCGVKYVSGVNKTAEGEKVFVNDAANELKYFSGVLINIKAANYEDVLVGRPYVKIGESYYYGEPIAKSIYALVEELNSADTNEYSPELYDIMDKIGNGVEISE